MANEKEQTITYKNYTWNETKDHTKENGSVQSGAPQG
jgi:hypothetical protein